MLASKTTVVLPQQRTLGLARPVVRTAKPVVSVRAAQPGEEAPLVERKGSNVALAAVLASALITSAIVPDEALAAKSGGRVGGSSGFRSTKAATRAAPQQTTVVNNTTVVGAPSVFAPTPFFGGFGFMPTFVMPFPFFGGMLQLFLLMFVVSAVFGVVRAIAANSSNNSTSKKDDGWGDL